MVVDLSHFQVVTDFKAVFNAGYRGVINKATEGTTFTDKTYASRRGLVHGAGLLYGCYHFIRPGNVKAQVEHFLTVANPDDDMLLALDYEDAGVSLMAVEEFLGEILKRTGRRAVLYGGAVLKEKIGGHQAPELAKHRLWLAQYTSHPSWPSQVWKAPWLWQFTGDGAGPKPHSVPGISNVGIDINSYEGSPERLRDEWAAGPSLTAPEMPVEASKPPVIPVVDAHPPSQPTGGLADLVDWLLSRLRRWFGGN